MYVVFTSATKIRIFPCTSIFKIIAQNGDRNKYLKYVDTTYIINKDFGKINFDSKGRISKYPCFSFISYLECDKISLLWVSVCCLKINRRRGCDNVRKYIWKSVSVCYADR